MPCEEAGGGGEQLERSHSELLPKIEREAERGPGVGGREGRHDAALHMRLPILYTPLPLMPPSSSNKRS
jgi:hypothetical protein